MLTPSTMVHDAALLLLLTLSGSEVCVAAFVEPLLRRADPAVQRAMVPPTAKRLGTAMPFWYAPALLLTAVDWWLTRSPFVVAAAGVQVLVLLLTFTVLLPINNRLASGNLREGWMAEAQRWDVVHRVRVVLLLVASVLLLLV